MRTRSLVPRFLLSLGLSTVLGCGDAGRAPDGASSSAEPRFLTASLPPATTGVFYEARVEADVPHPPAAFRVAGGRLPEGLALDGDRGVLRGHPRVVGPHRFEVEAIDGADPALARDQTVAAARARFDLPVARGPLVLLDKTVPPLPYRGSFRHRFEAAGGTPPYVFRVAGGNPPPGLWLGGDGEWRGAATAAGGGFSLRVRAQDAHGESAEADFPVRVLVPPLRLAGDAPPSGAVGAAYSHRFALKPAGAGPPHEFRVVDDPDDPNGADGAEGADGVLPEGLVLDLRTGVVEGTPVREETRTFVVEATDEAGQVVRREFTVTVGPAPAVDRVEPPAYRAPRPEVTISGVGFQPGMRVRFGAADPVAATVLDPTLARAVPPLAPLQSGPVDVVVENLDGGTGTARAAFRYARTTVSFARIGPFGTARGKSRGLDAGDLDGDGRCDLAHAGSSGIEVLSSRVATGSGAPTFAAAVVRSDGSFDDLRVGDVDADGDLDLVVARSSTTESIETYRNDGKGRFPAAASATTPYPKPPSLHQPHTLALGDCDGDGVLDVALTSARGNQGVVWVLRGLGDGSFQALYETADGVHEASGGLYAPTGVVLADLDGDGRDDLALADAVPAACSGGGASCPTTPGPNLHPGRRDFAAWTALAGADGRPGTWRVARTGEGAALDGSNPGLCAYDHDGDGLPDLAVFGGFRDERGMGIAFLRNEGGGVLGPRHVEATAYARRFGARIDADGDACDDVVAVGGDGPVEGGLGHGWCVAEAWLGGGPAAARGWSSGPEDQPGGSIPGSNPGRVCVGDFDADGLEDFAVAQSFHVKERFQNEQGDGSLPGVAVFLNRSR